MWARSGLVLAFCLLVLAPAMRGGYQPNEYPGAYESQPERPSVGDASNDRLAEYTQWLMYFTGILAAGTLALWYVTWRTLRHAQDEFVATERPWVSISDFALAGDAMKFKTGGTIPITYKMKNFGRSPAIGIRLFGKPQITWRPVMEDPEWLSKPREGFEHPLEPGQILFPGEERTGQANWSFDYWDLPKNDPPDYRDMRRFVLVGCVDYGFAFQSGRHRTVYRIEVHAPQALFDLPVSSTYISKDYMESFPQNQLRLTHTAAATRAD